MRYLLCLLLVCARVFGANFTVHEWGTFTSIGGSDGKLLNGLEVEEAPLPVFVLGLSGLASSQKGFVRPVKGVTVKMETPVIYFYSDHALSARVSVKFHGGSISQWYPDRIAGEQLPVPLNNHEEDLRALDFSKGHEGSVTWKIDVLARDTPLKISAPTELESAQWPRARVPSANLIQNSFGTVENFIFYRGLGNFSLPLAVTADANGALTLTNRGDQTIPFLWVYRKEKTNTPSESWTTTALAAGEKRTSQKLTRQKVAFAEALVAAGLTKEEAEALNKTWRESYFEQPGLRVFWIVPRTFTDAILPMQIKPQPERLERVLVGRTEVLTPAFENTLLRDFAKDGGKNWQSSRYFNAYRERAQQLRPKPQPTTASTIAATAMLD